jgi:hypothetical protein
MHWQVQLENLEELKSILPLLEVELQEGRPVYVTFPSESFPRRRQECESEQDGKKVEFEKVRESVLRKVWEKYDAAIALFLGILVSFAAEVVVQIFHFRVLGLIGLVFFSIVAFIGLRMWLEYRKELAKQRGIET